MEPVPDLTHDVHARDWQEYIDACFCHDRGEPIVKHAWDLAHAEDQVLAATVPTQ